MRSHEAGSLRLTNFSASSRLPHDFLATSSSSAGDIPRGCLFLSFFFERKLSHFSKCLFYIFREFRNNASFVLNYKRYNLPNSSDCGHFSAQMATPKFGHTKWWFVQEMRNFSSLIFERETPKVFWKNRKTCLRRRGEFYVISHVISRSVNLLWYFDRLLQGNASDI